MAFSPDGQLLVCISRDKVVTLWDLKTKERILKIDNEEPVEELPFSIDGSYLSIQVKGHQSPNISLNYSSPIAHPCYISAETR